ncbi:bile acid:sodium symporter family protein [Candidatus Methylacidiphilum infernorum]|uniref:Predicted Na+-dependent transporter n=1 Tax=Methylacidiphilum infernorum (isolate V4) TaxID=481448 RepID=B3DYS6_METI4|nr:bile acid:sodium symporter [Candidatus Methylacidiphilum infernorum]ACD82448.1 Predicted Na+-dependent transporter [Methylacidiphilum infernorum V4]
MSIGGFFDWIHKRFFFCLILSYLSAALFPQIGLFLRSISFFQLDFLGIKEHVSFPLLQLFILLFNGGFGVKFIELKEQLSKPFPLILGIALNLVLPLSLITLYWWLSSPWHNPLERSNLYAGIVLIIAMPIAGSTVAWVQNSNANLSLCLGMVILSTLFSPVLTPVIFHMSRYISGESLDSMLGSLGSQIDSRSLLLDIVIPSSLGMLARLLVGDSLYKKSLPLIKPLNEINLLILIYSNATTSLPNAIRRPDADFFLLIVFVTFLICLLRFVSGLWIGKLFGFEEPIQRTLTYSLGMNNNGMGLVLANMAYGNQPAVILPVILYNLFQQILAAFFYSLWTKKERLRD